MLENVIYKYEVFAPLIGQNVEEDHSVKKVKKNRIE